MITIFYILQEVAQHQSIPNAEVFVNSRKAPLIIEHGEKLDVVCGEGLAPNNNRQPICNNGTWSSLPTCVQGEFCWAFTLHIQISVVEVKLRLERSTL